MYWLHRVHEKTITLYMLRNSGKQRWILTKFYTNTVKLNRKQVAKFSKIGWLTSAIVTASLVRSLKSISVHYRHRRDWLSSVRPYEWQDFSTSESLCSKCPPCAWSRTQAPRRGRHCLTTLSMTTWWKCSHCSIRRDFSWSCGCGTHAPAASTKSGNRLG